MPQVNVEELAEELNGTCREFDGEHLSIEQLQELDALILRCTTCSWWDDADRMEEDEYGEYHCEECRE